MSKKRKRLYFRAAILSGLAVVLSYVFYMNLTQNEYTYR